MRIICEMRMLKGMFLVKANATNIEIFILDPEPFSDFGADGCEDILSQEVVNVKILLITV